MVLIGVWPKLKEPICLGVLFLLAVVLYAGFAFGLPKRFNSPDEAANAYFAERLAAGKAMVANAELNAVAENSIIHPRSTHIVSQQLAPASFLGLPLLLGWLGRWFGAALMPYLTPLGALLGLWCFYLIVRELSGNKAAWFSAILLMFTPAFWYYHSRSFFHNALFFDFLLLSLYWLLSALKTKKIWFYIGSGLALGVALSLRTSEVFWLTAAGLCWLLLNRRQVQWRYVWLIGLSALVSFSPVLVANYNIYGSILSVGYRQDLFTAANLPQTIGILPELMLPFGFHPRVIMNTVTNYLVKFIWWWGVMVSLGLIYFLIKWRQQPKLAKSLLISLVLVAFWLMVVYGSWQFHDNPDPSAVTLGTSYVRYWLPIYGLLLWPAGLALARLSSVRWGKAILVTVIGGYIILSALLVWWEPVEGLSKIKANIIRFDIWRQEVQALTEEDSIIVAGITDKIFWPERQVIYDLVNPVDYESVGRLLARGLPVYWFHPTWPAEGLAAMNRRLARYGLKLELKSHGWQDFSLYKFLLTP